MSTAKQNELIRFRCECGAVLTARANLSGRKGKCKSCGAVMVIPSIEESLRAEEAPDDGIGIQEMCSVCQTAIEDDDDRTTCNACELPFHEECWEENLGCSAYGCSNVNALKEGPDIRVGALPTVPPSRPYIPPSQHRKNEDDIPWDHLLLAGSAIAALIGFVTCGVPTLLVSGLALWRISRNMQESEPIALPVLSLVLCGMATLFGCCLSAAFWNV